MYTGMSLLSAADIFLLYCNYALISSIQVPTMVLNDGNRMPILAFGTYLNKGINLRRNINKAVEMGYRHFDTAEVYNNEEQVGEAMNDVICKGLVKREDLFITTKLADNHHQKYEVVPALQESLQKLGLEYVDLYLIHSPNSIPPNIDVLETWQGMLEAKKLGLTKSIGVSNFNTVQLSQILAKNKVMPAVNQIEVNPSHTREYIVSFCQKINITITAYAALGYLVNQYNRTNVPPPQMEDPILVEMAQKYGKTTIQIVLRYSIDRGLVPIPMSRKEAHLRQNIDIFDFKLTPDEVETINQFNQNWGVYAWQ